MQLTWTEFKDLTIGELESTIEMTNEYRAKVMSYE